MTQHAFTIADQPGASFLVDLNNALAATATNSSGDTEPSVKYANQWWADTINGVLKQRDASNVIWMIRATLATSRVVARASNTILGIADYDRILICTGTWTQTLTAAATLGDGWKTKIINAGSGVITIDPNASETIDGATTILLSPGESAEIFCNGTLFYTGNRTNVNALDADAAPAAGDYMLTYDISTTRLRKVLISSLMAMPFSHGVNNFAASSSRVLGTTYTNSTGYPMMVCAWCALSVANDNLVANIGGSSHVKGSKNSAAGNQSAISFIVPPGATYQISPDGSSTTGINIDIICEMY